MSGERLNKTLEVVKTSPARGLVVTNCICTHIHIYSAHLELFSVFLQSQGLHMNFRTYNKQTYTNIKLPISLPSIIPSNTSLFFQSLLIFMVSWYLWGLCASFLLTTVLELNLHFDWIYTRYTIKGNETPLLNISVASA